MPGSIIETAETVVPAVDSGKVVKNAAAQPNKIINGKMYTMDGNEATATVAFGLCEVSFIYPITPSSTMAELADAWSAAGKKNVFGQVPEIFEMESEAGAAGALHGALVSGSLATTFTASQGLLLMVPNMYKIAGELLPCVIHVSARAIAGQALSIFGDHSDVMLCRSTGWALLASHTVQECCDMALVAHLATIKASVPFVHFFEGFRISHEVSKINIIDMDTVKPLVDDAKLQRHRYRGMNPNHPNQRGTAQGPEVFFQAVEAANTYYDACAGIVEETFEQVAQLTGRHYKLFEYEGDPEAEHVIVLMGAGCPIVKEAIEVLRSEGRKVGMLKVRLFRPWRADRFVEGLPRTTKRIAVLDRCKESGALGEPLYLDVSSTLNEIGGSRDGYEWLHDIMVVGGRFGLGSKDFSPGMAIAVFDTLATQKGRPRNHFTLGINDDVTHLSLPVTREPDCVPKGTVQCLFWGMGADGTVGANKEAIKIIGSATDLYAQGYFAYDAHKSGGVTVSHLRFGPSPITSSYLVKQADYVAVHHHSYLGKYDWHTSMKPGCRLVLNCEYPADEASKHIPVDVKKHLAELGVEIYVINALEISRRVGLGKRINMIMQAVFFYLSGVMPFEKAISLLKNAIEKAYSRKGPEVVEMNYQAVDQALEGLKQIKYDPATWLASGEEYIPLHTGPTADRTPADMPKYVREVVMPVLALKGDELPVSAFTDFAQLVGGVVPPGTTMFEKREIAPMIPKWIDTDKCTQCNECSIVCPHAAIRPQLTTAEEVEHAPGGYHTEQAKGAEASGLNFRIQVSPYDCTGCELCVHACPQDVLEMRPANEMIADEDINWEWGRNLPSRGYLFERNTVKGSQFQQPLLEFSGACDGCGETPYVKLLTQLFGERMVVANATGCSSIWGGSAPVNPYTTDAKGRGPAWANSLFEDNAQFGLGIATGIIQRRSALKDKAAEALTGELPEKLQLALAAWLEDADDAEGSKSTGAEVETELEALKASMGGELTGVVAEVYASRDLLTKPSIWVVGGDGWAYDIGFGGLDHVMSSGIDLNILVLDTEMYSNTGGQRSKSTPLGAVVQFASGGKRRVKKDLGAMAMAYGDCYVASCCLEADFAQVVRSFSEAEAYKGTSIVMAFAPCILQGLRGGLSQSLEYSKQAVDTGYWTLYRFHPERAKDPNTPPLMLDSKKVKGDLQKWIDKQNRFVALQRKLPQVAEQLSRKLQQSLVRKRCTTEACAQNPEEHKKKLLESFRKLVDASSTGESIDGHVNDVVVLYGSETGNAEALAHVLATNLRERSVENVACMECDESSPDDLEDMANRGAVLIVVISTAGQGEFPKNSVTWYEELLQERPEKWLSKLRFAVFGLGDSAYCHFCKAAVEVEHRLGELGAVPMLPRGVGDDQSPDKYETAWMEWQPQLFDLMKLEEPPRATEPPAAHYTVASTPGHNSEWKSGPETYPYAPICPQDRRAFPIKLVENIKMAKPTHDRDVRNLIFDVSGAKMRYFPGDCLAIYPRNSMALALECCGWFGMEPDAMLRVKCTDTGRASRAKRDLPRGMTNMQLLTDVLDMFGRPLRSFYEAFAPYVSDPDEKARMDLMLSRSEEGRAAYQEWISETPTYFDAFKAFPSCKSCLDLPHILDLVPTIKPRLYSIASSQREVGLGKLELAVVVVDWETPKGQQRIGTCTSFLSNLNIDPEHDDADLNTLMVYLQPTGPGGIFHPKDPTVPVMMVGLGTGLAPFRAMVQERKALLRNGEKLGESALYFGCRTRKDDYLFGDEWEAAKTDGYLTNLLVAFSRDQAQKIYVQNKIEEEPMVVWRILIEEEGFFFFCGPARRAPEQVRNGVEAALMKAGDWTKEQATAKIDELIDNGHYVVEAWA